MKKSLFFLCFLFLIHNIIKAQDKQPANETPKAAESKLKPAEDTVKLTGDSARLWKSFLSLIGKVKDKKEVKISPFSLSFGYNFDFLDGIKTNELYADLRVDLPNILRKKDQTSSKGILDRLGIEVGAYQLRTVSRLDTVQEQFRLTGSKSIAPDKLQLIYITVNSNSIRKTIRENLDVYIQPKVELMSTKEAQFNWLFHFEWLRSTLDHSFERNISKRDTTLVAPPNWPRPYYAINEVPGTEKDKDYEYNFYLGTGFDLRINTTEANFYLKMICGYNGAKLLTGGDLVTKVSDVKDWFYLTKFEVLESQVTGIKLGVEVRGAFPSNIPSSVLDRTLPGFGIYLAKQFTFEKVGDLLKP